jgi:ATP-dependent Clp protease adaptor protein ClpS
LNKNNTVSSTKKQTPKDKLRPKLAQDDEESGTSIKVRPRLKKPNMYKVLLHNDDYTLMEFVVEILQTVFSKTNEEAHQVMMKVHTQGAAICGIYTYEVAESKVNKVLQVAKTSGHPLKCTFEKIDGDEEQ